MRISASVTLISLLAGSAAFAATACDLSGGSSCSDYGGCYDYGTSGGYYGGALPDAAPPTPTCTEAFSVAFTVPEQSGDCQLVLGGSSYGYGSSYYDSASATYYFAQPLPGEAKVPCEVIDGPTIGRCARERSLVVVASSTLAEAQSMRSELSMSSYETTFRADLSCARIATPQTRIISFRCGTTTPATPQPGTGDAGASDASADGEADDGGDAGGEDASPELLH